jgi:hypothetical protein
MSFWGFIFHDLVMPGAVSYLSVYLDQMWHARREFATAYARAVSMGKDSMRLPEKNTIRALFDSALFELQYRSEQAGKPYIPVLWDLERDIPGFSAKDHIQ